MSLFRLILPFLLLPFILCSCAMSVKTSKTDPYIDIEAPNKVHAAVYANSHYLGMTPYKLDRSLWDIDNSVKISVRFLGDTIYSDYTKQHIDKDFLSDNEKITLGIGLVAMGAGFVFIPFPASLFVSPLATLAPFITPANKDSLDRYVDSIQVKRIHEIQEAWFTTNKAYKNEIPTSKITMDNNIAYLSKGLCYDENDDMVWLYASDSKDIFPIPAERTSYCREFKPMPKGKAIFWGTFPTAVIGAGLALYNPVAALALGGVALGLNLAISLIVYTDTPSLEECKLFTPEEKRQWLMQYSCKATSQNQKSHDADAEP